MRHGRFLSARNPPISPSPRGWGGPYRAHATCCPQARPAETVCADATALPFADETFDRVFVGYGLRNFPNLIAAVQEIKRVTRPGGMLVSLDFFLPGNRVWRRLFLAYLYAQGTFWGTLLHGHPRIYTYIPDSLRHFVSMSDFAALLQDAGYVQVEDRAHLFGGIGLHWAVRP